ncbi:hypothetical protein E2562_028778 [Oryza meyeriana var. granulata]|uniref:Uncharacterized protein n=1 Tax=Oryza meyeriana var. granulata TaxID=110450 RepID=A0A6G1FDB3_9ORYZ|nr:hypothetical protein E2562_028778 [Oryza meyeriana var. granulata]
MTAMSPATTTTAAIASHPSRLAEILGAPPTLPGPPPAPLVTAPPRLAGPRCQADPRPLAAAPRLASARAAPGPTSIDVCTEEPRNLSSPPAENPLTSCTGPLPPKRYINLNHE